MQTSKKTVALVEDNKGIQQQLLTILSTSKDIECLYAVSSGEEALKVIPDAPPNVVLMDIQLPGMSGIECTQALKKRLPSLEILVLTIHKDSRNIFRALEAGANGYLIKSACPNTLFQAIRDIDSGGAPFSPEIARKVIRHFQEGPLTREDNLSPRETEIINLVARGFTYKEVGDALKINSETVRSHVKSICNKMQVRNKVEAVAKYAYE